ncbi:MAG: MFS transporter [Bacteroidia bacterium]
MSGKEIRLVLLLSLIQFTGIVDFMIMMPLKPLLTAEWGVTPREFGVLVFSYGFGAFLSSMVFVNKVDMYDRKKILLLIYTGFTICTFLCSVSSTYVFLLTARFATGLFGGIASSVIQSIVGDAIHPSKRGQAMGLLMTGFSLASVIGVPGGLYLASTYTWSTPFFVLSLICLVVWLGVVFIVPNFTGHLVTATKMSLVKLLKNLLSDANKVRALLLTFIIVCSHFLIIPFLTDYFTANLKFDFRSTVPLVYVVGGLLSAFVSPMVGKLSDKYGRQIVITILTFLSLIPILGISNLSTTSVFVLLSFTATFFIFSGTRMIINLAHVTSTVEPKQRGAFLIINSSIQQFGTSMSSLIGGFIVIQNTDGTLVGYEYLGYGAVVLAFIALFLFKRVKAVE